MGRKNQKPLPEELLMEWDYERNRNIDPTTLSTSSGASCQWICSKDPTHKWTRAIRMRAMKGSKCPFCYSPRITLGKSLLDCFPEIAKQWHPTKNNSLKAKNFAYASHTVIWWLCEKGHEWKAPIKSRTRGLGCPGCGGYIATPENNLQIKFPDIAKEWILELNNNLSPKEISPFSDKKGWWQCSKVKEHQWYVSVSARTWHKRRCIFCFGKTANSENNLMKRYPEVAAEWDYLNNKNLTPEVCMPKSGKKVYWECVNGHKWMATIADRTYKKSNCPHCTLSGMSRKEIYLRFEICNLLNMAVQTPERVTGASGKQWSCDIVLNEYKIIGEYDGAYHHSKTEHRDNFKTLDLTKMGWTIIRLREKPLNKCSNTDIIFLPNENIFDITSKFLIVLAQKVPQLKHKISIYIDGGKCIAEAAASRYINFLTQQQDVARRKGTVGNLREKELKTLAIIRDKNIKNTKDLALTQNIGGTTANSLVRVLLKYNLITRSQKSQNKRFLEINLTTKGYSVLAELDMTLDYTVLNKKLLKTKIMP